MTFGALLVLALGLAMDATAVAAARGIAAKTVNLRVALRVGLIFGGAQAGMPLLGYAFGHHLGRLVAAWAHWIAFALLAAVGGKMLWEARGTEAPHEVHNGTNPFGLRVLLVLAVATSIDAFAAGVSLPLINAPLVASVTTIGVTTALLSGAAVLAARRLGGRIGRKLDALGGLVLLGLAVMILLERVRVG